MTSLSSNRTLNFVWMTPPNSTHPHIASVTTDPVIIGNPTTAQSWTYTYDNDLLKSVCEPNTGAQCATHDYTWVSQHANTVLNSGPYSFWRLNEESGAMAALSAVISNDGADTATYSGDVTLGGAAPLPDSTSTSAMFDGSHSSPCRLRQ